MSYSIHKPEDRCKYCKDTGEAPSPYDPKTGITLDILIYCPHCNGTGRTQQKDQSHG